jgi:putative flippase GtrA
VPAIPNCGGRLFAKHFGTVMRFAFVGAITTTLDVILFAGLTAAALMPAAANVLSYSCGILLSYILNRSWTFKVEGSRVQAMKFVLSTLTGLVISTLLVSLLAGFMPAMYAKLLSVPVVFVWNYLTARIWVFNAIGVPENQKG